MDIMEHSDATLKPYWRSEFKRLEGSYAPATLRAYYTDVQKFTDWCSVEGRQPFPANPDTECNFIAAQGEGLRPGSVRRSLCAIRKIRQLLRLPDATADEDVNMAMRRLRRTKLGRPRQVKGMTHDFFKAAHGRTARHAVGSAQPDQAV